MTTFARWLPLLAIACTGSVEDDSEPTGTDDSNTPTDDTDDSATGDDSDTPTKGDRWDGIYQGLWVLTFDKIASTKVPGTCTGSVVVTVAGKTIDVDVETSKCDGVGLTFYGPKPPATITGGDIVLDPGFPSNTGTADFLIDGTKEDCAFEFDWTFSDVENHPTQVVAEYQLRSEEQFKDEYCAGAGYWFELYAEIPKKED
jgi:hypothetical protein